MVTNYRTFLRRMTVGGLATGLSSARNVVLLPFLTRGLSMEDYGALVQAVALVELLSSVSVLALASALTRFTSASVAAPAAARGFWSSLAACFAASTCLALLAASQAEWISGVFFEGEGYEPLVLMATALVPLTACERLLVAFLHARLEVARHALGMLAESVLYVGLAIWFVHQGAPPTGVLAALMIARVTVLVGGTFFVVKAVGYTLPDPSVLREYLRFGLPLVCVAFFAWISGLSDRWVIGYFHGQELVGAYSVAYTLGMLTSMLFSPMFSVLTPTLVPLWEQGDRYGVLRHLYHATRYSIAGTLPFVVGLTVLAEPLIRVVAGAGYVTTKATVGFAAAGILFLMISGVLEPLVALLRKTRTSAVVYGVAAATNLLVGIALVPSLGALGAAIGTCIAFFVQLCIFYLYLRRHGITVSLDLPLVAKCAVCSAVMAWVVGHIEVEGIVDLVWAGAAGGAVYLAGMVGLRALPRDEIRDWVRLLRPGGDG